ncbi:MAG: hypothetical protein AAGA81_15005 [Acidobacteriota bacterium]
MDLVQECRLFRHEIVLLVRSPAFWPSLILTAVAISLAAWNGSRWTNHLAEVQERMTLEQESRWRAHREDAVKFEQGTLDPAYSDPTDRYTLYGWTPWASRLEQRRLAFLAIGQSDIRLSYRITSPAVPNALGHQSEIQNPSAVVLGRLDLARCVTLVLPLLLLPLLLTSSSETSGALSHLIEVHSGSARLTFLRRIFARWCCFCGIAGLLGLALVAILSPGSFIDEPLGLLIALVASGGYLSTWAAVGLATTLQGWSGTRSAMAYALLWFTACFLAPASIDRIAKARGPQPASPLQVLEQRVQDRKLGTRPSLAADLAAELGATAPLPDMTNLAARVENIRRENRKREVASAHQLKETNSRALALARFVPPLLAQRILQHVAGTDAQSFLAFEASHRAMGERRVERTLPALFRGEDSNVLDLRPVESFLPPPDSSISTSTVLSLLYLVLPAGLVSLWSVRSRR